MFRQAINDHHDVFLKNCDQNIEEMIDEILKTTVTRILDVKFIEISYTHQFLYLNKASLFLTKSPYSYFQSFDIE